MLLMLIRPRTARRCTALIYAAEPEGHLTIVQILLDHGADPNIRDHIYKHSAMVVAVRKKCYGMNSKRNYNPIIAELLWRRIPHDQKTWHDQINSVIEIVKKKKCLDILDMFVNWRNPVLFLSLFGHAMSNFLTRERFGDFLS